MTLQAWSKVIAHMYKHMKCKWILCLLFAPILRFYHPSIPCLSLAAISAPHLNQAASILRALISSYVQFFFTYKIGFMITVLA